MKISDIYAELKEGRILSGDAALVAQIAIERLAQMTGLPVAALDFAAPRFAETYPHFPETTGGFGRLAQYRIWRSTILDLQMRAAPGDTDGDPWVSLPRAARLDLNKNFSLAPLWRYLPENTAPGALSDALIATTFQNVPNPDRPVFRNSVRQICQLFKSELAVRSGLLPPAPPTYLPGERDHRDLVPMAPAIDALRTQARRSGDINALDYINRLAIAGGLLNGTTDWPDDLRGALVALPDPERHGIPGIGNDTRRIYINRVVRLLGGPDPRRTAAEQAWAELYTAARAAGCETNRLWTLRTPASAQNLCPWQMSKDHAVGILRNYQGNSMPAQCRHGCEQFDALQGKIKTDLLPPEPLDLRRTPPRPRKPVLPEHIAKKGWKELYAVLREKGWTTKRVNEFSYLRPRAIAAEYAPGDLTQAFIDALGRDTATTSDRTRLRAAVSHLHRLAADPGLDLPMLVPPTDSRRSHGGVPDHLAQDLEELMDFMNSAPSRRRAIRVAVGVLSDALDRPDLSLEQLLHTDASKIDLGCHMPRRDLHLITLGKLRDFRALPWTENWRQLQQTVVAAGISHGENPVPKILEYTAGREPDDLDVSWARAVDQNFRSLRNHPPHGRADLALTFARRLEALDRLHDDPDLAHSGLLPSIIGDFRRLV